MSRKGTKIKRYGSIYGRSNGSFIMLLIMAAGVIVFGVAGWFLYTPVYNFIMGLGGDSPVISDPSVSVQQPPQESSGVMQPEIPVVKNNDMAAVYIPAEKLNDREYLISTLDSAAAAGFNSVITDAKDAAGKVLYKSVNGIASAPGIAAEKVYDAAEAAASIKEKGLSPAVMLHAFRDSLAPTAQRDMAVHYYDTEIYWFDNSPELGGKPWLDPYSKSARKYLLEIVEELAESGFETIFLDSVQFPSGVGLDKAGFADESGKSKADVLKEFINEAEAIANQAGCKIILCSNADFMAPGAEAENNWLYGGSANELFTEKVMLRLGEDKAVWDNRISMIDEVTDSELVAMIPAYDSDGMLSPVNEIVSVIDKTSSDGYVLFSPNGYYKFS